MRILQHHQGEKTGKGRKIERDRKRKRKRMNIHYRSNRRSTLQNLFHEDFSASPIGGHCWAGQSHSIKHIHVSEVSLQECAGERKGGGREMEMEMEDRRREGGRKKGN